MSVIIRLQNLPLTASSIDIRTFFRGLSIPDGGVHIVGGSEGDVFVAFSTDEDARQAMQLTGQKLKDSTVRLLLSSRNEMYKVIEQARVQALGHGSPASSASPSVGPNSPSSPTLSASTTPSSQASNGGFPTSIGNMLGGMGLSGPNSNSFTAQHSHGISLPGMGSNLNGFQSQIAASNPNSMTTDTNVGNSNPFGITAQQAMQGMGYHHGMMNNSGNGLGMNQQLPMGMSLPMNMNQPPPGMMSMPPIMMNNQPPGSFQGPRGMMLNNNNMNGSGNNMSMPPAIANILRPNGLGGFIPGMNPNFTTGGMGNIMTRPTGPTASRFSTPPINSIRERNPGAMNNGPPPRQGAQGLGILGKPDLGRDLRDRRSRSGSRERRDNSRRRRSRSLERDRGDRRRRHSRSKSRSRSPKGRVSTRRDSRDRNDRRKGESSPDKGRDIRGRRDSDPVPNAYNMTNEEYPGIKLIGIPKDVSYREIRDFLRVDIMGGGDGTVRLYDECIAYVKLEKASEYSRAYRSNGRKLRNSTVTMEGISIERWVNEYKMNKSRVERDIDRDKERDRVRDRDDRGTDRDRPERSHRPSRFNSAPQSSFIVIRNLPPTITSRDVSSRLLKDSPVAEMIVSAGPVSNGRHTAMVYVKLESTEAAQKTIDLVVRSQDGANLVVEVCDLDEFTRAKNKTPGRGDREIIKPSTGDSAKSIFDLESGLDEESCSVMLKGAPPHVAERDVFDFFSDIGLVPAHVKIMYDANGSCNGQIICEFIDPHKARRATTKDGMLFGRGHVEVQLMTSGRRSGSDLSLLQKGHRPALLGPRPTTVNPRFGIPPGPNPFVQALQAANVPLRPPGPHGARIRGPFPSRFNPNTSRVDKDDRLGGERSSRVPGHHVVEGEEGGGFQFGKPGCVLSLENVPYKASMDDILHHLSSILKLDISREKIIRRFDDLEKPTGDARVAFDTIAEAKLAYDRLSGTKMWNRLITYTIV